ncbi:hypothetical protein MASR2M29_03840 [Spirochaetota bacterium]
MPEFDDNKGISLTLVNTFKGQKLFEDIEAKVIYKISNTKDCLQHNLHTPSIVSGKREQFWKDYHSHGYEYVIRKYANYKFSSVVKNKIKCILKKMGLLEFVRKLLKKD